MCRRARLNALANLLPLALWRPWIRWQSQRLSPQLPAPLRDYYQGVADAVTGNITEAKLLALDLELTALTPDKGEIVSVGCVPIDNLGIQLAGAQQWIVQPKGGVGESAVHHQLTDTAVNAGEALAGVLPKLLQQAEGRILLIHHAELDLAFIRQALQAEYGLVPPLPAIDTMHLAAAIQRYHHPEQPPNRLRLSELRQDYQLPAHHGHQALTDAIACAELFFAQLSHRYQQAPDVSALLSAR
ncbi:hypothetical protein EZV61_18485 [Corallincola luteus]|uniref:Exonuclease domain-containing protein n=1 Tax=Corallincola luteus TaxID=1775177 RepID=A0ABY2AFQ1_9GAMM|nr:hypothetical protein EZV61_18485 [Corallincola luteus]